MSSHYAIDAMPMMIAAAAPCYFRATRDLMPMPLTFLRYAALPPLFAML